LQLAIRTADHGDAESISVFAVQTYVAAFGHSFSSDDLRARIENELSPAAFASALRNDVVLLAEASRLLVGYAQFGAGRVGVGVDAELRRLYVQEGLQSQGIGSRLMDAALARPVLAGEREISLDVWVLNPRAQQFYARYGFRVVGEREFKVASGGVTTPDLIMVRRAAPPPNRSSG
jgi:ribosomal protein S18 acetylase RimI-like enzyme